jgi:hypothetical protein
VISGATPTHSRLVALGASNLTRILPTLVAGARLREDGPLEVLAALGFGRSYGAPSSFLVRGLPGIDGCGLWDALAKAAPAPTTALVMDVGNDILYGFEVARILEWIDRSLERLRPRADRLVVAGLPATELSAVGPLRYGFVRTFMVPSCRVTRAQALSRAERLHEALGRRAVEHGARFVEMSPAWYGFDPIHVRRSAVPALAEALLGPPAGRGRPRPADRARILLARPSVRTVLGIVRTRRQPSARLADGTTVALY